MESTLLEQDLFYRIVPLYPCPPKKKKKKKKIIVVIMLLIILLFISSLTIKKVQLTGTQILCHDF